VAIKIQTINVNASIIKYIKKKSTDDNKIMLKNKEKPNKIGNSNEPKDSNKTN
jgi:hypothetical protein